jgi:hypothetical protein
VFFGGYWMVNALNRRNWIFLPLIMTGFNLMFLFGSVRAAVLKDIRVGEYEEFTRVVLELDVPCEPKQIQSTADGRLTVAFADTSVGLIRKIPVERSQQLKQIQIWYRKNTLSAVMTFNFARFRYETFPLNDPPRIVLDIHPLAAGPPPADEKATSIQDSSPVAEVKAPTASFSPAVPQKVSETAEKPSPPKEGKPSLSAPPMPRLVQSPAGVAPTGTQWTAPAQSNAFASKDGMETAPVSRSKSNRLQFYLVIVLVLITIGILVMLLFMLLWKRRWADSDSQLSAQEYLRNQDKHIESLNERIQEQFKRYEEA